MEGLASHPLPYSLGTSLRDAGRSSRICIRFLESTVRPHSLRTRQERLLVTLASLAAGPDFLRKGTRSLLALEQQTGRPSRWRAGLLRWLGWCFLHPTVLGASDRKREVDTDPRLSITASSDRYQHDGGTPDLKLRILLHLTLLVVLARSLAPPRLQANLKRDTTLLSYGSNVGIYLRVRYFLAEVWLSGSSSLQDYPSSQGDGLLRARFERSLPFPSKGPLRS